MIGFVGERARRKKRNTIIFLTFIMLGLLIYLAFPKLQLDENVPSETLLPSDEEIVSPELKVDKEDLELQIFQKEQKIIFRDQQINKLKNKIEILTTENITLSESINRQFTDTINQNVEIENSKEKIKKIQLEAQQKIEKLIQEIATIKKDNQIMNKSLKENINEKQLLNTELKKLFNENQKLIDKNKKLVKENKKQVNKNKNQVNENKKLVNENKTLEIIIKSLEQQIGEQETLNKKLEDISHH